MKYHRQCFAVLTIALALCACGKSSGKNTLATVNGEAITEEDINFIGDINPRIKMQIATPEGQRQVLSNLIDQQLLYHEAVRRGLNRDPKVKAIADLYRRVIIAQALVDNEADVVAKKYYDEHQDEFKKLEMSHISIGYMTDDDLAKAKKEKSKAPNARSEEAALKLATQIKERLDKGEEFTKVASETSEDMLTKNRGGALGPVSKDDRRLAVRGFGPLVEKAFEMKVGEVGGPVKTQNGYHLILVTKGVELEPFDAVKEQIAFKSKNTSREDLMARLKKDAKIVYPGEDKAKAAAPTPEAPTTPPSDEHGHEGHDHPHGEQPAK